MDSLVDPNSLKLSDGSHIGMGLILSKQIIEEFGGSLDFSSELGTGSTFVFSFGIQVADENIGSPRFGLQEQQSQAIREPAARQHVMDMNIDIILD